MRMLDERRFIRIRYGAAALRKINVINQRQVTKRQAESDDRDDAGNRTEIRPADRFC